MNSIAPPRSSDPASAVRGEHSNSLDALRLILAGSVVLSHSYALAAGASEADEPLAWASGRRIDLGEAAVDGFFILSGFLIAQSWGRSRSPWTFARKRVARIYPGYLVAATISVLVAILVGTPGGTWSLAWQSVLNHAGQIVALRRLIVPGSWPASNRPEMANGSTWTISYECFCYAGVAALGLVGLLRNRAAMLGLYLAAVLAGYLYLLSEVPFGGGTLGRIFGTPDQWARLLPCYLGGVLLYLYGDRVRWSWPWACLALGGLVALARLPHGLMLGVPTLGAYLALYCGFAGPLRWHGAARYGDFSYGIYLYAWPIQQAIVRFDPKIGPVRLFAEAGALCLVAGVISWYAVERNFLPRPAADRLRPPRAPGPRPDGGGDPTTARPSGTPDPA